MRIPRVAFFTDSFHEVNGVALTSRKFAKFARDREYPFLSVHAGAKTHFETEGNHQTLELANSRASLELDRGLVFDSLFLRHYWRVMRRVRDFAPDIVHVTGPGHLGILGAMAAFRYKIPMAASWHTNLHQFAARRLDRLLQRWPSWLRGHLVGIAENGSLHLTARFYQLGQLLFAPNPELVELLSRRTGRSAHLMLRGIDNDRFSPRFRSRTDDVFTIGFVGRLSPEKNVRILSQIEHLLLSAGVTNYRFLVVGDGSDREWLARHMRACELPGVLQGVELATAYANMDVFVFPSETDTFGNVVVEAMASGVPAIVSGVGGPKYLIEPGVSGLIASDEPSYADGVRLLMRDQNRRVAMGRNALRRAAQFSWEAVFQSVYAHYQALGPNSLGLTRQASASGRVAFS